MLQHCCYSSKVKTRSEAVERRMVTAQGLLRQLDTALQGTASSSGSMSSQRSVMLNKVGLSLGSWSHPRHVVWAPLSSLVVSQKGIVEQGMKYKIA